MDFEQAHRRRWFGGLFLVAAVGMLISGQTVLEKHLKGAGFLFYWFFCLLFTIVAGLIALWDARILRQQSRQEQRKLLEGTLQQIQTDAQDRSARNRSNR